MDQTLTASEVCIAAKCPKSTLRGWRNRNGLFPHHADAEGWTRYDMADAIGVRLVVILTERGIAAQDAVNLTNQLREILEHAAHGHAPRIGIGRKHPNDGEGFEFKELTETGLVLDQLGFFDDACVFVINLNALVWEITFSIREQRGLDPLNIIGIEK